MQKQDIADQAYHVQTGVLCLLQGVDSSLVIETNFIMFAKSNFSGLFSGNGVFLSVCAREILVQRLCTTKPFGDITTTTQQA
jgi:hypothetical protein